MIKRTLTGAVILVFVYAWLFFSHIPVALHIGTILLGILAALIFLCGYLAFKPSTYSFTDEEFAMAKTKNEVKGEVIRAKGLGALSAEQAHNSMFNEKHQRLDALIPDDESIILLRELMGDEVEFRKEFVFNEIDFSTVRE